jgi:hypothetical protein
LPPAGETGAKAGGLGKRTGAGEAGEKEGWVGVLIVQPGCTKLACCLKKSLGGIGVGWQNDRFLRPDRGGNSFGARQRCSHVQQTAFRSGKGLNVIEPR